MVHKFGVFEFDSDSGELKKNGRGVALEPQPAKALALLLIRAGEIVSREELRDAVWGADTHVDFDRGIAYCVSQIRGALGDSGENPRFVQTVPKRGFKFIAPVTAAPIIATAGAVSHVLQAPHPMSRVALRPLGPRWLTLALVGLVAGVVATAAYRVSKRDPVMPAVRPIFVGVSIFDNETGMPEHDRLVAGLSDLVVARLANLDPERVAIIGNSHFLRQPRNIRRISEFAQSKHLDYLLLGQLQKGESGLRFITHFIRLSDEAHLKANRLTMPDGGVSGLEAAVVEEFERAVRQHLLNRALN